MSKISSFLKNAINKIYKPMLKYISTKNSNFEDSKKNSLCSELSQKLDKIIDVNLWDVVSDYDVLITKNGKTNKGWAGQLIEQILGLKNNNSKTPDFVDFELKTISLIIKKTKGLSVKESMAITMINPENLVKQSFYESDCYKKLKDALIVCRVVGKSFNEPTYVHKHLFLKLDESTLKILEQDYELVRQAIINGTPLTGKMGTYIQPRTKGSKNSSSRAFYARPSWLEKIVFE